MEKYRNTPLGSYIESRRKKGSKQGNKGTAKKLWNKGGSPIPANILVDI